MKRIHSKKKTEKGETKNNMIPNRTIWNNSVIGQIYQGHNENVSGPKFEVVIIFRQTFVKRMQKEAINKTKT